MVPLTTPELLQTFAAWRDRPLLVTPGERLTYEGAVVRSAALARRFLAEGIGKHTRVVILLANGSDWVTVFFALTRVGAHAILLNPFAKAPELAYALRHSDAHAVVTGDQSGEVDVGALLIAAVPALGAHDAGAALFTETHPFLRRVWWLGETRPAWADDPAEGAPVAPEILAAAAAAVSPADPMFTSYTSGTTAEPKAVVQSHGAILRQAEKMAVRRGFADRFVVYTPMPLFWMGGICWAFLGSAVRGMTVVTDARFDAGRTLDLLEREHVTHVYCWPQAAEGLVTHPSFPERDLSRLEAGPPILRGPAIASIPADRRENSLGMTETCGPHTYPLDADALLPDHLRGSFGPAVEGMEHRIVDRETLEPLPDGEVGELLVRGDGLMLGFHKRERQDTFLPDGWYRTGDLCSWRDGRLFFHGRGGDMIKSAGFNVAPAEVERVIDARPDVSHVVVMGLPDPVREQVIGALVGLRPGATTTPDSLTADLKEQLSSYKVPTVWRLVDQDDYPMGVTGKVDRTEARDLLEAARADT